MNRTKCTIFSATLMIIGLGLLSADEAQAHPASGIVVDRKGQVYFSDLETVWKIDTQGRLTVFREGVRGTSTNFPLTSGTTSTGPTSATSRRPRPG